MGGAWTFWGLCGLMTLGAVGSSVWPWWSRRSGVPSEPDVSVYQARLADLDMALDYPAMTPSQREQEKQALMAELLEALQEPTAPSPQSGRWVRWFIGITLPITAFLLYALLGGGASLPFANTPETSEITSSQRQVIERMVSKLNDRLAANPADVRALEMLGRSYMALARYPEAVQSYARAIAETTDNHDRDRLSVDYVDARWLAGMSAFQTAQYTVAVAFWTPIKALLPPEETELLARVTHAIAEAEQQAARPTP